MKTLIHKIMEYTKSLVVCVFIFSLLISSLVVGYIEITGIRNEEERVRQIALAQTGKIQYVINNLLYTTRTIETLVRQGHGKIENFDMVMANIIANYSVESLSLAPDGIVAQTYPLKGNEATIGHDLFKDPTRSLEAVLAKDSGELTLAGPYTLIQGGIGAIGRQPIYLSDDAENSEFWGFACVVLRFPDALKAAEMKSIEDQGYAYELWHIDPYTKKKQILVKSKAALYNQPQKDDFELPNSTWTLSITPEGGWIHWLKLLFKEFVAILISVLVALLYHNVVKLARSRNDLDISIQQQTANYKKMDDLNSELRDFRHDMKNHLLSLSILLDRQDIRQAQTYINEIGDGVTTQSVFMNTENYVLDALLAEKVAIAREKGILVDKDINIQKQLKIENMDCTILFGNILDNAIEACEKATGQQARIKIFLTYKGNILYGVISNTALVAPTQANGNFITTKMNAATHGMGMKRIASIIKKYDGIMDTSYVNGIFTISITMIDV